ncbi:MAG: ABC transporter ATP-binding protein [Acetobacteraceae bacterium]|nr:ABC transporter ATP-binding protein [Acetobacteraceae bacterium]
MTPVLETRYLTIRFGGQVAVDSVSLAFHAGTTTAIVGPNGAGKTTFLNLISGQLRPSAGDVFLRGKRITAMATPARARLGLGRAFQLTNLFPDLTVLENVRLAVQARAGAGLGFFHAADTRTDLTERAQTWLSETRLSARAHNRVTALSHGDQRKLEVAMMLALEPEVFMFDEPTAGMSVDEVPMVLDLIAAIAASRDKTVLLIEHKMDVVRRLADRVVVLHQGALVADGEPAEVVASAIVQEAYLGIRPANG